MLTAAAPALLGLAILLLPGRAVPDGEPGGALASGRAAGGAVGGAGSVALGGATSAAGCGAGAVAGSAPAGGRGGPSDRARGRPRGPLLASGLVATACLAAFGASRGLAAAAVAAPGCYLLLERLRARPTAARADRRLALPLDLTAAVLRAGRPLPDALELAAPAAAPTEAAQLRRIAGLLRLGADPVQAWSAVPRAGPLGVVAATAIRSAASGIKLAASFERVATELRAEAAATASARAQRTGVTALAPLAACFLPSFVCLGVVPVVVGMLRGVFDVLV